MTKRIFIPTDGPQDWKRFLAEPDRHWKHEYSAFALAQRCGAGHAVMLVHSFSRKHTGFEDYAAFAKLFGSEVKVGTLVSVDGQGPVTLHLGWADGS